MLQIRRMTGADIPFGMRLKEQAGWNQTVADWSRLLDLEPDGCFVAELDDSPAGTVTTCRFGPVAWVAMMLVDSSFRSQGIGRALMTHALDYLDSQGAETIRLDASSLGRPLYESLGFVAERTIARYAGLVPPADGPTTSTLSATATLLDGVIELDRQVSGTNRGRLIRRLAEEQPDSFRVVIEANIISGFLLARPGSKTRRIGPCTANEPAAHRLFADARRRYEGEMITMDIPADNAPAIAIATSWDLDMTGSLTRMSRGPSVHEDPSRLWASAGPEKG